MLITKNNIDKIVRYERKQPNVIVVDYLNICVSSRLKMGNSINSYQYVMAIGQELRGLAQEFNVPIVTATQTNHSVCHFRNFFVRIVHF